MRRLKLLVVDDDRDIAESLAEILELRGHQVELAFSGEEALEKFQDGEFDVTLMDVRLPGTNGIESLLEMHRLNPEARVVMMTGFSVEHLLRQAVDKGAVGVLRKPIDHDRLFELLERARPDGIVLVADDNPDFVDSLVELLRKRDHRVLVARTGREALETMQEREVDFLILDLRLPVMSGLEVYLELKALGHVVPTVIVTAYALEEGEALDTLTALKVNGILHKPFTPTGLLAVIDEITGRPSDRP